MRCKMNADRTSHRPAPLVVAMLVVACVACRTVEPPGAGTPSAAASVATPAVIRAPDDLLRLVSAATPLPPDYVPMLVELPTDAGAPAASQLLLVPSAADAVRALLEAAQREGAELRVLSAFRSYLDQERAAAELTSAGGRVAARPGTSDRQLGTAVVLVAASAGYALDARFAESPEAGWLQAHAHEYGFALADPSKDDAAVPAEPWHYRYIGREEAARWHASGEPLGRYLLKLR